MNATLLLIGNIFTDEKKSPCAVKRITLQSREAEYDFNTEPNSRYISLLKAFFLFGLLRVIIATSFSTATLIVLYPTRLHGILLANTDRRKRVKELGVDISVKRCQIIQAVLQVVAFDLLKF